MAPQPLSWSSGPSSNPQNGNCTRQHTASVPACTAAASVDASFIAPSIGSVSGQTPNPQALSEARSSDRQDLLTFLKAALASEGVSEGQVTSNPQTQSKEEKEGSSKASATKETTQGGEKTILGHFGVGLNWVEHEMVPFNFQNLTQGGEGQLKALEEELFRIQQQLKGIAKGKEKQTPRPENHPPESNQPSSTSAALMWMPETPGALPGLSLGGPADTTRVNQVPQATVTAPVFSAPSLSLMWGPVGAALGQNLVSPTFNGTNFMDFALKWPLYLNNLGVGQGPLPDEVKLTLLGGAVEDSTRAEIQRRVERGETVRYQEIWYWLEAKFGGDTQATIRAELASLKPQHEGRLTLSAWYNFEGTFRLFYGRLETPIK